MLSAAEEIRMSNRAGGARSIRGQATEQKQRPDKHRKGGTRRLSLLEAVEAVYRRFVCPEEPPSAKRNPNQKTQQNAKAKGPSTTQAESGIASPAANRVQRRQQDRAQQRQLTAPPADLLGALRSTNFARILVASLLAQNASKAVRQAGPRSQPANSENRLTLATSASRAPSVQDVTTSCMYNHLWAAAGCPKQWPIPRPFFSGITGRRITGTLQTYDATCSLAAGAGAVILVQPHVRHAPIRIYDPLTFGSCANAQIKYGEGGSMIDMADSTVGQLAYANVVGGNPVLDLECNGVVKVPPQYTNAGVNSQSQLLGGQVTTQVMSGDGGTGLVYIMDAHRTPNYVGHALRHRKRDCDPTTRWATNDDSFVGYTVEPPGSGSQATNNAMGICSCYGELNFLPGNSHQKYVSHLCAERGWTNPGELEVVDAPVNGVVSDTYNMDARNNYCVSLRVGYLAYVYNNGADPIIVTARYTGHYAIQPGPIDHSGAAGAISGLAATLARSAPLMPAHHFGAAGNAFHKAMNPSDPAGRRRALAGAPTAQASMDETHHTTIHNVLDDASQAGGAALLLQQTGVGRSLMSRGAGLIKSARNTISEELVPLLRRFGAFTEEAATTAAIFA